MLPIIAGSVIVFSSLLAFNFSGCSSKPKYKVGDCIAYQDEAVETWEAEHPYKFSYKIIEVGKNKYRTEYWAGTDWGDRLAGVSTDVDMSWANRNWFKINCETLEKL